jgi:hypothetical protein
MEEPNQRKVGRPQLRSKPPPEGKPNTVQMIHHTNRESEWFLALKTTDSGTTDVRLEAIDVERGEAKLIVQLHNRRTGERSRAVFPLADIKTALQALVF